MQDPTRSGFRLTRIDLTVKDMDRMSAFYSRVFDVAFQPIEAGPHTFLVADVPGLCTLQLVPQEVAGITAEENRHQLNLNTADLELVISRALDNGGTQVGEVRTEGAGRAFGVRDPDGNYIVFTGE